MEMLALLLDIFTCRALPESSIIKSYDRTRWMLHLLPKAEAVDYDGELIVRYRFYRLLLQLV